MTLYHNRVESTIVHTKSPRTVSFLDQENRGREKAHTLVNNPILQHGPNLIFDFLLLEVCVMIRIDIYRFKIGKKVNDVVSGT